MTVNEAIGLVQSGRPFGIYDMRMDEVSFVVDRQRISLAGLEMLTCRSSETLRDLIEIRVANAKKELNG